MLSRRSLANEYKNNFLIDRRFTWTITDSRNLSVSAYLFAHFCYNKMKVFNRWFSLIGVVINIWKFYQNKVLFSSSNFDPSTLTHNSPFSAFRYGKPHGRFAISVICPSGYRIIIIYTQTIDRRCLRFVPVSNQCFVYTPKQATFGLTCLVV